MLKPHLILGKGELDEKLITLDTTFVVLFCFTILNMIVIEYEQSSGDISDVKTETCAKSLLISNFSFALLIL